MTLDRLRLVAAKVEGEKGTAETLANADADILAIDPRFTATPPELEREELTSDLDRFNSIPGPLIYSIAFGVYVRGSGTAITPPGWFKLHQGCGCAQSVNSADVTLDPESDDSGSETLTIALMIGSDSSARWFELKGARGNATFTGTVNGLQRWDYVFTGVKSQVQNAAPLTLSETDQDPQKWYNAEIELGTFTTGNYGNFTFDLGNEVEVQQNANDVDDGLEYAEILSRNPSATIDPRQIALATYNPFSDMETPTNVAFQLIGGTGTGRKFTLTAPECQVVGVDDQGRQGHAVDMLQLRFRRSSGDDSWSLKHE
jgi:hypothetical protein